MMFLYGALTGSVVVFVMCLILTKRSKEDAFKPANLLPPKPMTDQDFDDMVGGIIKTKEVKHAEVERLDPEGKVSMFNDHLADRRRKHSSPGS